MAPRKSKPPPEAESPGPVPLRAGMPVRLLAHDWPFLFSVLGNGDLVMNKRLPVTRRSARTDANTQAGDDEAPV